MLKLTFTGEDSNDCSILVDVLNGILDLEETAIWIESRRLSVVL